MAVRVDAIDAIVRQLRRATLRFLPTWLPAFLAGIDETDALSLILISEILPSAVLALLLTGGTNRYIYVTSNIG